MSDEANKDINKSNSFSFEISIAEIVCKNDNAEILESTMKNELTRGLKSLSNKQPNIFIDRDGNGTDVQRCLEKQGGI